MPSRLNQQSRDAIAEIDGELLNRASRLGGFYQPKAKLKFFPVEEIEQSEEIPDGPESEGKSQIITRDNRSIADFKNYNTTKQFKKPR